ncbi:C40 family peptidase [Brevundimonas sp. AAP58]|uniref:C40 family peptidase n=1 Tax=Brevundimonas sp. AAP58 TaxID=1523422 RepID=UPI0006B995E5|nr:NlpC/P60 family protein [Brevundimonas sp. AAP58]
MTDAFIPAPPLLARPDLAALSLEGMVRAEAYRPTRPMRAVVAVADIHAGADTASERIDQLLFGEAFDVLDEADGRAWGQARRDGVVGWIDLACLAPGLVRPTQTIRAVDAELPLNALVVEGAESGNLRRIGTFETDPVEVAERLVGTPHELGARSSRATDCSGLVQQALLACGFAGPRRSHEQAELGESIARTDARRGDLVIWLNTTPGQSWTGHSALMLDATRVVHASGHHGAVVIEMLAEADARYLADGFEAARFRRIL